MKEWVVSYMKNRHWLFLSHLRIIYRIHSTSTWGWFLSKSYYFHFVELFFGIFTYSFKMKVAMVSSLGTGGLVVTVSAD